MNGIKRIVSQGTYLLTHFFLFISRRQLRNESGDTSPDSFDFLRLVQYDLSMEKEGIRIGRK